MSCSVSWTEWAEDDVDRAVDYIVNTLDNRQAAKKLVDDLHAAIDRIASFPEMHAVPAQPSLAVRGLRACFIGNYVLLYRFDGEQVIVYRVFSALRDYARLIERTE